MPEFDPTQPSELVPAASTAAPPPAFDPSQPSELVPAAASDRGTGGLGFDPSKPSVVEHGGQPADLSALKWGLGTTFGLNPDGSVDTEDNGRGAPQLGSHNTRDPNLVGVALPEAVLRAQLGDDPAAWRKARVQVFTPDGSKQVTAPLVDLGPGAGPQARNVTVDLTYGAQQALGADGKTPLGYRILPDAQPDPLDNGVGRMHDLGSRFIKAMDKTVLGSAAGLARISAHLVPGTEAARNRANALADALEQANQDVQDYYASNPALDATAPAKIATAAGSVAGSAPLMATGALALPLLATTGASGAYEEHYRAAIADGDPEEKAKHTALIAAVKTAPELLGYLVAGKLGAMGAAKILGPEATPLLRGLVGGATALPANVAAGAAIRGAEGENILPDAGNLTTDALFATFHGFGEHARATDQANRQLAAGEELAHRGIDPQTGGPVSVVPHDAPAFDPTQPSEPVANAAGIETVADRTAVPRKSSSEPDQAEGKIPPIQPSPVSEDTVVPPSTPRSSSTEVKVLPQDGQVAPEATLASPQQATLPRRIDPATPQPAAAPAPISEASIREYLSRALDIPVRLGLNIAGKKVPRGFKVAGLFHSRAETIRTRLRNDIPTISHEVGHYLHQLLFNDPLTKAPGDFGGKFDAELRPLGKVTSGPKYTPEQIRKEGVAEFTREWLTDRTQALAKAPLFTQFFEGELQSKFPETREILEHARDQVRRFLQQPGWEKARSRIAFDPEAPRVPFRQHLQRIYTNWFDQLNPAHRALNKLVEFGLDPALAKQVSGLMINYKGGWKGKADYDLEFNQTDLEGNHIGPSLKTILTGIAPKEMGDFSTYVALKRAAEKKTQGVLTGFEADLADPDVQKQMHALAPRFEGPRQKLRQYSQNLRDLMVDSGLISKESAGRMDRANADYVPFYRIYEGVNGGGSGGSGSSGGFINTNSGVLRMKGSDRQIIDPLESVVKNTHMFRDLAERNRVGLEFAKAAELTQGGGRVAESILAPMKPTRVASEEIIAKLKALHIPEAEELVKTNPDLSLTIFRAADGVNAKDGIFRVWDQGKEKLYQSEDPDLLRALALSDTADAKALSGWRKWLAAPASLLRAGATHSPEFIFRNITRDQFTAAVYSEHGFIPYFDGARGVLSVLGKDHWYRDWVKAGGKYSGLFEGTSNQDVLQKLLAHDPVSLRSALQLLDPRTYYHALSYASAALEEGTRVAEFRLNKAAGKSDVEAANASKDVTLNFAAGGGEAKALNRYMTFLNAKFLDLDKIVRAHKEHPGRTALKGFLAITLPSLYLWNRGKDDPKIQNLPEWRKQVFWNMNIGGNVISWPKPFLLGAIYGTLPEKVLDWATKRDPNAGSKAFHAIVSNAGVDTSLLGMTTAFKPVIENISNYSFFAQRPLVNEAQAKLSPSLQFTPTTSETAKWLGARLNYSPILIDNAVQGFTGGSGRYGTDLTDWFFLKAQGKDTPAPPKKALSQYPVIRGFTPSPYEPSQYVQRFYQATAAAEQRLADFGAYAKRLDAPGARQFVQKNKNELAWYNAGSEGSDGTTMTTLRGIRDNLSDLNQAMIVVRQSRQISAEDKATKLRQLGQARDKIAEAAFKSLLHPTDREKAF